MTTFIVCKPSVWEGAASILDFGGTLTDYSLPLTPAQADALALSADWQAIAGDLHAAVDLIAVECRDIEVLAKKTTT